MMSFGWCHGSIIGGNLYEIWHDWSFDSWKCEHGWTDIAMTIPRRTTAVNQGGNKIQCQVPSSWDTINRKIKPVPSSQVPEIPLNRETQPEPCSQFLKYLYQGKTTRAKIPVIKIPLNREKQSQLLGSQFLRYYCTATETHCQCKQRKKPSAKYIPITR
mgnify:CR=1 FL=1